MGTFEVFDHTADVGLSLRGEGLADLLETAARAVFAVMLDEGPTEAAIEADLAAETGPEFRDDLGELLVVWLQELLARFETERLVPLEFVSVEAGGGRARARIRFGRFDPARHVARAEIKAVTYHGLEVRAVPDGTWSARLVLDV